ncbi:sporulation protein YpjB [Peribacillus sp. SCS-155]|uniref:sporulation protein YpjB n=1 Tax=Peribacillus sedimenti TaxID=3115297 RepID=UPI003906175F
MFKRVLLFTIVLFTFSFVKVHAETSSILVQLDEISDEALRMAKMKRYEDTGKMLDFFAERFLKVSAAQHAFNMDELRIITVAHNDALQAVKNNGIAEMQKVNAVTKFRLVMDAIKSTHQPLWTEMEDQIMSTFSETKEAVQNNDPQKFNDGFNKLLSQYEMIYPSLMIDLAPEKIQKLDARLEYINQNSEEVFLHKDSRSELYALQKDLKSIFDEMNEDEADPSLWWMIISTGSIIILTLSYVGWRKYQGDKEKSIGKAE